MAERALTQRPPFDVELYARESESGIDVVPQSKRGTQPPPPEHANLRESCKSFRSAMPSDSGARTSGVEILTSTPTLGAIPVALVSREDLEWFELDDRARAILAVIDSRLIVEEILAVTHTPIAEGVGLFAQLARLGLVAFRAE